METATRHGQEGTTYMPTTDDIIHVSWGSPPQGQVGLLTVEWDDDIDSWPATLAEAETYAAFGGLTDVCTRPDGVTVWTKRSTS